MKLIVLGDIHGNPVWEKIVKKESFDKIIFLGDYFDSFNFKPKEQLSNFKKIVEYKKEYPEKVILLFGNHDYHYASFAKETYSGFKPEFKYIFSVEIDDAIKNRLIQLCYKYNNILFSHAGLSKYWGEKNGVDLNNLEIRLNDILFYQPNKLSFNMGRNFSYSGDDITQSPIWIRIPSLFQSKYKNIIDVVGHTQQNNINLNKYKNIIPIDALNTSSEYLIIDNNKFFVGKIEPNY